MRWFFILLNIRNRGFLMIMMMITVLTVINITIAKTYYALA